MKPDIADRWVAALRSGEYEQGRSVLRSTDNTYCCLGVLCDLAAQDGVGEWSEPWPDLGPDFADADGEYSCYLPPPGVMRWAGLKNNGGYLPAGESLWRLNDDGLSFGEISDVIQANVEVL